MTLPDCNTVKSGPPLERALPGIVFAAATMGLCWLGMQAVHEAGHVAAAWLTGGTVQRVVLHPATVSRTDVSPNPSPAVVVWGGPLAGMAIPLGAWGIAAACGWSWTWLLRFFAGFCCVANGAYLAGGAWMPAGDTAVLRELEFAPAVLIAVGLPAAALGIALWNGLSADFFGPESRVRWRHAAALTGMLVAIVGLLMLISSDRG